MTTKNPSSIKDITASWLTSALHDSGNLGSQIEITKISTSDIEGHISGTVHRLEVSYSSDTNCPNTFILKFITAQKGDSSPEKELYVYQNIDKFGFPPTFRPPKPYLALKFENNYIFLLEDLACMTQIPQKQEGVDYETAQRIVMSLACFHAKFWDSSDNGLEKLREAYCPLAEQDSYWENLQDNLEKSLEDFITLVRDKEVQKTSQFCASHLAELVKTSRKPPVTVLQGDASAANYFLEGARGVIAVDWQGLDVGSGPGELAYFLSMSVQEDVRKKHETEFLHLYHDMLAKRGVDTSETGFTFDQCYKKYLIGVATSSLVPIKKARAYLEVLDKEKELSQRDKAIHDNVKPMIDLWCITANNHPITSLNLDQ